MFYVYIYFFDDVPRYVGKGSGLRWKSHRRADTYLGRKLRKVNVRTGNWVLPTILPAETEAQAFDEEVRLIAELGRTDLKLGTLWNLTDGGEGAIGALKNPFIKAKHAKSIRDAFKRPEVRLNHSMKTKAGMTAEVIQRMVQNSKASRETEEYKRLRSQISKSFVRTLDYWEKHALSMIAAKGKIGERTKIALSDPIVKLKMSEKAKARCEKDPFLFKERCEKMTAKQKSDRSRRLSDEKILEVYYMHGLHREISEKTNVSISHVGCIKRLDREVYKQIIERKENESSISRELQKRSSETWHRRCRDQSHRNVAHDWELCAKPSPKW